MNFKPYTMKDYKKYEEHEKKKRLGGIGSQVGSDRWNVENEKKRRQLEYIASL